MVEAMMQKEATSRETRNLIASDRVEGTPVRSADGTTIGTIERVMIDKLTGSSELQWLCWNGEEAFAYPVVAAHLRSKTRGLSPRPRRKGTQRAVPWVGHRLGRSRP
jgi:PRC-barrel domain protein